MKASVSTREIQRLVDKLERLNKASFPYAVRNSLNRGAFAAQKAWRGEVRKEFTLRNQWTIRSIRVDKARGPSVRAMSSRVGSTLAYMAEQEKGSPSQSAVPLAAAANQSGSKRTRPVAKRMRLGAIGRIPRPRVGQGRKERNIAAVRAAKDAGRRFAIQDTGRGKAIYRVMGSKKKPKIRKLWTLRRTARTPANPTLQRTLQRIRRPLMNIYAGALRQQLKRLASGL